MESVDDIVKEHLVGKTLVSLEFDTDVLYNREIVDVEIENNEDGDPKLYIYLKMNDEDTEAPDTVQAYMNEGLVLK